MMENATLLVARLRPEEVAVTDLGSWQPEPGRSAEYYRRKADQHWDMAGLARQDRDQRDAEIQTAKARRYEQLAREAAL